jgi:crotonobetainyl-CoA:carnitine CoA-transferase CaiB-like acyl-CoA transferase
MADALPLAGLRVCDVTTNIAGPYATMILADLGAEVWKVERPGAGDDARGMGPFLDGVSCYFRAINRGKRSAAIDVRRPQGRAAVLALAARCRIFVENFRRGKAEALGLGFEDVRAVRPDVIYVSLSAYGGAGPLADRPGYDAVVQARSGVMSVNGTPEGGLARVGVSLLDMGSGIWSALAVLAALLSSDGQARRVDTSLYETGLAWLAYHLLYRQATGRDPSPQGTRHAAFAPYGDFPCADGRLLLGISNDRQFARLCEAIGRPELARDERFATNPARLRHRAELDGVLAEALASRPASDWEAALVAADVPVGRVQAVSEVLADPQASALGILAGGLVRLPLSLDGARPPIPGRAPALGEHTRPALLLAGYDEGRIAELERAGVVQAG